MNIYNYFNESNFNNVIRYEEYDYIWDVCVDLLLLDGEYRMLELVNLK